jgi:hypothetical protein
MITGNSGKNGNEETVNIFPDTLPLLPAYRLLIVNLIKPAFH